MNKSDDELREELKRLSMNLVIDIVKMLCENLDDQRYLDFRDRVSGLFVERNLKLKKR